MLDPEIHDNASRSRYELAVDGETALKNSKASA